MSESACQWDPLETGTSQGQERDKVVEGSGTLLYSLWRSFRFDRMGSNAADEEDAGRIRSEASFALAFPRLDVLAEEETGSNAPRLISNLRVSSAAMVSSRMSSSRRSNLVSFRFAAFRAATVGITPEEAAEERFDDVLEEVARRFDEAPEWSSWSVTLLLSRADRREADTMAWASISCFEETMATTPSWQRSPSENVKQSGSI